MGSEQIRQDDFDRSLHLAEKAAAGLPVMQEVQEIALGLGVGVGFG